MNHRIRSGLSRLGLACLFVLGPWGSVALADGGTLRISQKVGAYDVAIFTDPAPLRAGPVDVSVWVQEAGTSRLADVLVSVTALNQAKHQTIRALATRAQATNKLLQAARFELPAGGHWQFEIEVQPQNDQDRGPPERIAFTADVAERLPRWREMAGWIFWPLVPIGLFAAHLYLVGRSKRPASRSSAVAS